jgi:hypothetical protein
MRLFVAVLALAAFAGAQTALGCPGMQTAGKPPVIASTDGTPLPQTPVPPRSDGKS